MFSYYEETCVEFVCEKGILFDRWIKASKVTDYNSLQELMLNEEFKNCVPIKLVCWQMSML